VFWAVAGRTQAAEGKLATSFFAAEIGLDPISAFAKNSGALDIAPSATVTASSENIATNQQAVKAVDGIVDGYLDHRRW